MASVTVEGTPDGQTSEVTSILDYARVMPVHFHHLYVGGGRARWEAILYEQYAALLESGFPGAIKVGLVGPELERKHAHKHLDDWGADIIAEADEGWEDITLGPLHEHVQMLPDNTPVLYTHNKGGVGRSGMQRRWRRAMADYLVAGWKWRLDDLENCDVAAWNWLNPGVEVIEDNHTYPNVNPIAVGTFWWANAGYLKLLEPLPKLTFVNRKLSEEWIGGGNPSVIARDTDHWPRFPVIINGELSGWQYCG